jgi:hypothetical protein
VSHASEAEQRLGRSFEQQLDEPFMVTATSHRQRTPRVSPFALGSHVPDGHCVLLWTTPPVRAPDARLIADGGARPGSMARHHASRAIGARPMAHGLLRGGSTSSCRPCLRGGRRRRLPARGRIGPARAHRPRGWSEAGRYRGADSAIATPILHVPAAPQCEIHLSGGRGTYVSSRWTPSRAT